MGKTITSTEITTTLHEPDFTASYGLSLDKQPAYPSRIAIYYDDGSFVRPFRSLAIEPFFDYGHVSLIDHDGSFCKVFFRYCRLYRGRIPADGRQGRNVIFKEAPPRGMGGER